MDALDSELRKKESDLGEGSLVGFCLIQYTLRKQNLALCRVSARRARVFGSAGFCTAVLQKMHESEATVQCHVGHFDWVPVLNFSVFIDFCGNHGKFSSLFIA